MSFPTAQFSYSDHDCYGKRGQLSLARGHKMQVVAAVVEHLSNAGCRSFGEFPSKHGAAWPQQSGVPGGRVGLPAAVQVHKR